MRGIDYGLALQSSNAQTKYHCEESIDQVIYCGTRMDQYCACSGKTLYNGSNDLQITLESEVSHLRCLTARKHEVIIAACHKDSGAIDLISFNEMSIL